MVEKILNDTTPYGKIRASHEGSLHSSTLNGEIHNKIICISSSITYKAYLQRKGSVKNPD